MESGDRDEVREPETAERVAKRGIERVAGAETERGEHASTGAVRREAFNGGRPTRAFLGVRRFDDVTGLKLDPELGFTSGAIVKEVLDGKGAKAAGIRPFRIDESGRGGGIEEYGDVIVAIDGQPVRSFDELGPVLGSHKPKDVVQVTVIRGLPDDPHPVQFDLTLTSEDEDVPSSSGGM